MSLSAKTTLDLLTQMSSRQARYGTFRERGAARRIASFVSRRGRKLVRRPRMSKGLTSTKVHSYMRACGTGQVVGTTDAWRINSQAATGIAINGAGSGAYDAEIYFNLSGFTVFMGGVSWYSYPMPNFTDFTNLYDQYRIDWIDLEFTLNSNNSSVTNPTLSLPRVFFVEDHDDVAATNLNSLQQYDNLKTWQFGIDSGVMKRVRIHPTPLEMVYYTAALTGYQKGSNKKWINTAYPTIPHYGVKILIDPIVYTAGAIDLGYMSLTANYHITCSSTK